jgi:hypothetical protein
MKDTKVAQTQRENYVRAQQEGGHLQVKEKGLRRNKIC